MSGERKAKKEAKRLLEEFRVIQRRAKRKAAAEIIEEAEKRAAELEDALKKKELELLGPRLDALDEYIEIHLKAWRPNPWWETIKALLIAVLIALLIRWFFIEPFRIPSGSMIPTLLVGDQLMVNKLVFGPDIFVPVVLSSGEEEATLQLEKEGAPRFRFTLAGREVVVLVKKLWSRRPPHRGEVVVFRWPRDPSQDYIKRVIGLPGDKIEIRDGILYLNGEPQKQERLGPYEVAGGRLGCPEPTIFREELRQEAGAQPHEILLCEPESYYNYGPITVPPDSFFAMGDNRDQSSDSRVWGFIPFSHLKGTAMFIHLPLNPENHYLPRWNRFFKTIR